MLSNTLLALTLAAAGASTFASPIPVARDDSHDGLVQWSLFNTAVTACGEDYTGSDGYYKTGPGVYLVGVPDSTFGDGSVCGQAVRITADGKSASGIIVDSCGDDCGDGVLVTPELFKEFHYNYEDVGQFDASWEVLDASNRRREDGGKYNGTASWNNFDGSSETACGGTYSNSDLVVGIDSNIFGDGAPCGTTIFITAGNGQSHKATVVDSCPDCGDGGLTLSEDLFSEFYDLGKGTFDAYWGFSE